MNFIKAAPPRLMRDELGIYGGENRLGWHGDMDRCWVDNDNDICVCSRIIRTQFGNVEHVTISKGTGTNDGTGEVTLHGSVYYRCGICGEFIGIYGPKGFHEEGWLYKKHKCDNGHVVDWSEEYE